MRVTSAGSPTGAQLDEPHPYFETILTKRMQLPTKTRLAHAASAHKRQQAGRLQQRFDFHQLGFSSNQRRQVLWKIVPLFGNVRLMPVRERGVDQCERGPERRCQFTDGMDFAIIEAFLMTPFAGRDEPGQASMQSNRPEQRRRYVRAGLARDDRPVLKLKMNDRRIVGGDFAGM